MGWFSLGQLWLVWLVWLVASIPRQRAGPTPELFRFSGRKGMLLVKMILLFVIFWIGVGTQWVKGKDKGIAVALGYSGVCVIIVVSIRVYAFFWTVGSPNQASWLPLSRRDERGRPGLNFLLFSVVWLR